MRKTADEMATDILGQQAVDRKQKERWIATLTGGAIGTAAGLATRNLRARNIPSEILNTGLSGLLWANAPSVIWKNPKENASAPRWWKKDYSPAEHGLALGAGSGLGVAGGHLLMRSLKDRKIVTPELLKSFKGAPIAIGVMAIPAVAGYLAARKLMRMRDA